MLICNVGIRPRQGAIAADITEAAAALDASTIGQVVFATLVDDPASVDEIVDAYLGEVMLEAASASDSISTGTTYAAAIDEGATMVDAADAAVVAAAVARAGMLAGPSSVFINSSTTPRQANAGGVMVNV